MKPPTTKVRITHARFPTALLYQARAWGLRQRVPIRTISTVLAALVRKALK